MVETSHKDIESSQLRN